MKGKKIIAFCNQKGGVGKTTCTVNIGAGLYREGKKILLIDLDPQAHLTYALGIQAHNLKKTVYHILKEGVAWEETTVNRDGLMVIPSSLDLVGLDMELAGIPRRDFLIREMMETVKDFDYVLIDCPPSLGLMTLNGLTAAQEIYIPLQTEFMALKGMGKLQETIETVRNRLNRKLFITGIIATRYDARKKLNRGIVEAMRERFGEKLFNTAIRENISLAEAPGYGQTIFEYAPNSYGAQDFQALAREIIARG